MIAIELCFFGLVCLCGSFLGAAYMGHLHHFDLRLRWRAWLAWFVMGALWRAAWLCFTGGDYGLMLACAGLSAGILYFVPMDKPEQN